MARWVKGEQTVVHLIDRGRLDSFEASDLSTLADAQIHRATLRLNATAISALGKGDVDGCYAAAYDAYRMAAEALLACQGLRATGGDGSHMSVEDAVSAQFAAQIPAFAKPIFRAVAGVPQLVVGDVELAGQDKAASIPAFAKPIFERLRRTRHTAQYFDPSAAPITKPDAQWAIQKAMEGLAGAKIVLSATPPERFT